jgi:Kef-type K+ transport system membrane component KefB/mannitol/fructose-specific phosphotransferase system IIA component (Ntr-type)
MGMQPGADARVFAAFLGIVLAVTAMPVIARTLMDLNLYRSDMGMLVMAAAMFDDLAGWIAFSILLSLMGGAGGLSPAIPFKVAVIVLCIVLMMTAGRWALNRLLPLVQARMKWPSGVLSFAVVTALLAAALTEWLGVHAILGAFVAGVALGDSRHLSERTRVMMNQFVSSILAPIFFASVGLSVNFAANFDPLLCGCVLGIACAGKIPACGLAARLAGIQSREAWAIGFSMNARGVMGIVLGLAALRYNLIDEPMFVALVVMALITSMMVGPAIQRILGRRKAVRFADHLKARCFIPDLQAGGRDEAIERLCQALSGAYGLDGAMLREAVLAREEIMSTGMGDAMAVPHARLEGIGSPAVAVGISREGVDFNAPDGEPARLIFLILTPVKDDGAQVQILSDIARSFRDPVLREKVQHAASQVEFLSMLKSHGHGG